MDGREARHESSGFSSCVTRVLSCRLRIVASDRVPHRPVPMPRMIRLPVILRFPQEKLVHKRKISAYSIALLVTPMADNAMSKGNLRLPVRIRI